MTTTLAIAAEFIQEGVKKSGIPLTHALEAYLSITFSRYFDKSIEVDRLTVRITRALDNSAPRDILRNLADECLIGTALFERRLERSGRVRHYVGLGQMTYDAAGMTEQAYGFVPMMDMLSSNISDTDINLLLDKAKGGSVTARTKLDNVVLFKKPSHSVWI
mgnify:FL=1